MLFDQVVAPLYILIPYIFDNAVVEATDKLWIKFFETVLAVVEP